MDSSTLFCVCFFTDWIGEACKSWRLWKCKGEISLPVVSKGFKASLFFFFFPPFCKSAIVLRDGRRDTLPGIMCQLTAKSRGHLWW